MSTELTILHLSDLHFGDPEYFWTTSAAFPAAVRPLHDRPTLFSTLITDLNHLKAKYQIWPHMVVVSGDLLDRGNRLGIKSCVDFLTELAQALGLGHERFMLCPGNHDLDSTQTDAELTLAPYAELWNQFYEPIKDVVSPMAKSAEVWTRCRLFTPAGGPAVLSLNSCEILDKELKIKHGYVGGKQLKAAAELLDAAKLGDGSFRIALLHHHLSQFHGAFGEDYSILSEVRNVIDWLHRHGFYLVLHGHQHRSQLDVMVLQNNALTIAAGGSTGVSAKWRLSGSIPLQYQLLHLHNQRGGTRFPRKFNPEKKEWQDNEDEMERTILTGSLQHPNFEGWVLGQQTIDVQTSVSLPLPHGSPFHWRHQLDPAWFVDREESLKDAIERITSGSNVSVVSPVRSGRSSFLAALAAKLRSISGFEGNVYVFDLQRALIEGQSGLLRRFCLALGGAGSTPGDVEFLLKGFKKKHLLTPVFLLDEFEVLAHEKFDPPHLAVWLRSLANDSLVSLLTATPKPLKEIFPKIPGSGLNLFRIVELGPFDRKAANVFWLKYLAGSKFIFDEDQKQDIFKWSDGHPCKLMIGSDHLYRALLSGQKPDWKTPAKREWKEIGP